MKNFESGHRAPNPKIYEAVTDIFDDIERNVDLYQASDGITVGVGSVDWSINLVGPDVLILRDWRYMEDPVRYELRSDGKILKNQHDSGSKHQGLQFKEENETFLSDEVEALTLRAIVKAAHEVSK